MKVGDTVWVFDRNHRVYRKDAVERAVGAPIYSAYWVERQITGETSRSWLIGRVKVPKKGPHPGFAFTWQEVQDDVWIKDHRWKIVYAINRIEDAAVLRKIAELVGYVWEERP